jgi:hypothetical protein
MSSHLSQGQAFVPHFTLYAAMCDTLKADMEEESLHRAVANKLQQRKQGTVPRLRP